MRALAKCPACEKQLEETCDACIGRGISSHVCKNGEMEIVDGINWEVFPENEKELLEVEE